MNQITEQVISYLKEKGYSYTILNGGTEYDFKMSEYMTLNVRETFRVNHHRELPNVTCKVVLIKWCKPVDDKIWNSGCGVDRVKVTKMTKGQIAKIENLISQVR